ncbi:MAG: response regulator [Lachnospiraceae bacterium]|nr:response regulator [Lachnospiraceae bacterium]
MFDYVVSYDVAAFILIVIFSIFFFTRRRYKSVQMKVYAQLLVLAGASVTLDIMSVSLLIYRNSVPVWLNYIVNILYFLTAGMLALVFCAYSMNATNSLNLLLNNTNLLLLFELPYILYALAIITTPFTKFVFYFDENNDYCQGGFSYGLLIMIVGYLVLSAALMTFRRNAAPIHRRLPYYVFIVVESICIIIQGVTKIYLVDGFGSAIGVVTLYLLENNSNDLVDFGSQLFNRSGFRFRIDEFRKNNKQAYITGFGFINRIIAEGNRDTSNSDFIVNKTGEFLTSSFDPDNVFYLGNNMFAIVCDDKNVQKTVIERIKSNFRQNKKLKDVEDLLKTGLCSVIFPNDYNSTTALLDAIENGIKASIERKGALISANDIRHGQEKQIKMLEAAQELLKEKYDEAEIKMQKALEADKSKSLFLAQMSHEIRTPMTAILGMTELLLRDTKEPRIIEHANAIMSSGKTLIGIINDILDFSKIEAGKLQIINEEYYFTSTFYDVLNNIEQRISEKRLNFVVYFDPKIPAAFYGDEVRIKQIIINLLTNAVKYTEIGQIELRAYVTDRAGDMCTLNIVVADTGVGIAKENIDKLFNGFERLGAQKNKAIEGTGLGLAITKQLVDNMNGTIKVDSEIARGSTFSVAIPQKIVDDRDSIVLDECENVKLLILCSSINDIKNYRSTLMDFKIENDYATSGEDLDRKLKQKEYTHIIVPLTEFERRRKLNDPLIRDDRLVVGLYYREYMADVLGHRTINMPISSINLSTLILENTEASKHFEGNRSNSYVAPDVNMLVVDDNLVNLRIFVGLLEEHKMNIYTADSGMHCIEICRKMKFDLIFLDHMMPKKDGIETLHEMREDPSTMNADTPVVAFTANAVSGMKDMFLEQGFNDFLSKPIELSKLEDILTFYLPSEKIISIRNNSAAYNEIMSKQEENALNLTVSDGEEEADGKGGAFAIEGLNMEQALFYSGNSYDTLKDILGVFVEDGSKKLDLLVQYIEDEDFDNYRIEIHAVKSLCKGIGADDLSEKALRLENACKEGDFDYVRDNAQEAYTDYVLLLAKIDQKLTELQEEKAADGQEGSKKDTAPLMDVKEQLLCIKLLLAEFEENTAIKLADDLRGRDFDKELSDKIIQIDKMLHLYDYDGASEMIGEILDED